MIPDSVTGTYLWTEKAKRLECLLISLPVYCNDLDVKRQKPQLSISPENGGYVHHFEQVLLGICLP